MACFSSRLTSDKVERIVKVMREAQDVSFTVLAKRFGVSSATIQKINRDNNVRPVHSCTRGRKRLETKDLNQ